MAIYIGSATRAVAQPATKGPTKAADKGPASADEPETPQPQQLDAKLLIGDAVENANSPQYRKVTEAIDKFRNLRVKEARDLLAEARTTHPQLPPAEVLIAKLFILARQPQLALVELEQAVRKHPRDPEAYLMFAEGTLADRHVTAAQALYRDADELVKSFTENPKRKEGFQKRVLHGLAAVAESRQQWKTAEALLRQLIKLDPDNASAQFRLAQTLFQQASPRDNAKLKEAYDSFYAAWKADSRLPTPDIAMGRLFEQSAQQALNVNDKSTFNHYREQATGSFERATTPTPKYNPELNTLLAAAMWALQTNQFKPAQQYADAAMKKDPGSINAMLVAAIVARFSGNLATAERLLKDAYDQSPLNFAASNQLALVLIETDNKEKKNRALELAQINAGLRQNDAEAASTLGWVLYNLNRKTEAGQVLQNVVNARALSPDSAYYVAKVLADQGRHAEAMQLLEDALGQPQPFANRTNATELLDDVRKKLEAAAANEDGKDTKSTTSGTSSKSGTQSVKSTKGGK